MTDQNAFRVEIEQILLNHSHTRAPKVLRGMKRNLTDAQISHEASVAEEPCNPESIAYVRKLLILTLADKLVSAPSDAEAQANIYRELRNYPHSPNLHQHIMTRLAQLQQKNKGVKLTPLEHGHLGTNSTPRPEKQVPPCRECNLIHAGECP